MLNQVLVFISFFFTRRTDKFLQKFNIFFCFFHFFFITSNKQFSIFSIIKNCYTLILSRIINQSCYHIKINLLGSSHLTFPFSQSCPQVILSTISFCFRKKVISFYYFFIDSHFFNYLPFVTIC